MEKYLYLTLNILTISVPFMRSFEPRVNFYGQWKSLFGAIGIMGAFFIIWDILFTHWGVWGFNPTYLSGINIVNLPMEEWLFFLTVPYACVFIYEVLNYFIKKDILKPYVHIISASLVLLLGILAVLHNDKIYTFTASILTAMLLSYLTWHVWADYLGRFYLAFLVSLIPFFMVNGVLTGSGIPDEIVWYNNAENLAIRLGTIPIEDTIYCLLMLLMTISIYEYFKTRKSANEELAK